jgi:hypothetical protein
MKLQAPDGTTGELHLHGRTFTIDSSGQVEVPDELVGSHFWQQGYTVAQAENEPAKKTTYEASPSGKDKI